MFCTQYPKKDWHQRLGSGVHVGALTVIEKGAVIGDNAVIEAQVFIGEGCRVGAGTHVYPQVTLRVVPAFSGYLLDWLHSGEVDIAVVYGTEQGANIRFSPLLVENLCFVTAAGPEAVPHHAVSFPDVVQHRLVLPGPQHGLRILVEREARQRGLTLDIPVEADALQVLKGLVQRRLGATILPLAAVHGEVQAGLLAAAPIIDPHLSRKLVVAQPLGRQASHAVRRFAEVLRDEVTDMVGSKVWDGQLLSSMPNPL